MDHHTALKLVPLWSSDLKTSECTEFGPLTIKESDVLCPKCVFLSETDYHTALKVVPLWSSHHKTSECTDFGPLNTKKGDALAQNVLFFRSGSSYSFETCTTVIITPENLRVNWVWYSKYKIKGCFSPKCVFSEMDHHTALKLVPLWSSHLKTSECTEFLTIKKSDVFAQKVFFSEVDSHTALKLVPLWSSHLKTSGYTKFHPLNTKKSDVLAQNVFSQKWIIIQLWNLYHWDHHASKPQGALSLTL